MPEIVFSARFLTLCCAVGLDIVADLVIQPWTCWPVRVPTQPVSCTLQASAKRLNTTAWHRLQELGVCKRGPTVQGCRGDTHRQRKRCNSRVKQTWPGPWRQSKRHPLAQPCPGRPAQHQAAGGAGAKLQISREQDWPHTAVHHWQWCWHSHPHGDKAGWWTVTEIASGSLLWLRQGTSASTPRDSKVSGEVATLYYTRLG